MSVIGVKATVVVIAPLPSGDDEDGGGVDGGESMRDTTRVED